MAGNWPDPPGNRLAYDRDGTKIYARSTNTAAFDGIGAELNLASLKNLNDENTVTFATGGSVASAGEMVIIFPSLRDISHLYFAPFYAGAATFQWSVNTTNGIDGTWTTVPVTIRTPSRLLMRTDFDVLNLTGVKALRWRQGNGGAQTYVMHLYGKPTVLGDRLMFWHPTLNQPLYQTPGLLDWGDRPRGSVATKEVRVRNCSNVLSANAVVVGMEALTDASPSMLSQHQFAVGEGSFGPTAPLGTLAPQQISEVVKVRQDLLSTAIVSLWDQRLVADAGSWV